MKAAHALLAACALLAAAPLATAQAPAAAPANAQPQQQQPQAESGTSLNLKLEDPALSSRPRVRFGPAEPQDAGGLPSLGADARRIEETPRPAGSRNSPYPPDTNPGR